VRLGRLQRCCFRITRSVVLGILLRRLGRHQALRRRPSDQPVKLTVGWRIPDGVEQLTKLRARLARHDRAFAVTITPVLAVVGSVKAVLLAVTANYSLIESPWARAAQIAVASSPVLTSIVERPCMLAPGDPLPHDQVDKQVRDHARNRSSIWPQAPLITCAHLNWP